MRQPELQRGGVGVWGLEQESEHPLEFPRNIEEGFRTSVEHVLHRQKHQGDMN